MDTTNQRNDNGQFVPGHNGGPGRPKKAQEMAMLDAIKADWPPERVAEALNQAMQMALETRSWRGILSTAELVLSYGIGKPTQKIVSSRDSNLEVLLASLADDGRPMTADDVLSMAGVSKAQS